MTRLNITLLRALIPYCDKVQNSAFVIGENVKPCGGKARASSAFVQSNDTTPLGVNITSLNAKGVLCLN